MHDAGPADLPTPDDTPQATAVEGEAPFAWGSALRRALLRGLLLGLSLGGSLWPLFVTVISLISLYGPAGHVDTGWIVLSSLGVAAVCGLFAGVTLTPLALLEFAASRSRRVRVHATAAALSAPLTLLLAALLLVQIRYAVEVMQNPQQPVHAASNAFRKSWRMLRGSDWDDLCLACGLISAVPYALFARLRGLPRTRQLALVVPATAATSSLFALGFSASSTLRDQTALFMFGLVLVGVATTISALLPAVFDRADQVEGWVVRRFWPNGG